MTPLQEIAKIADKCFHYIFIDKYVFTDDMKIPTTLAMQIFQHFDRNIVMEYLIEQRKNMYNPSISEFVLDYYHLDVEDRLIVPERRHICLLPLYCNNTWQIWKVYWQLCVGKKPTEFCWVASRTPSKFIPDYEHFRHIMLQHGFVCSLKHCKYMKECHPTKPIVLNFTDLIKAQVGIPVDVNVNIPILEHIFENKTLQDFFETAAIIGGDAILETIERMKVRMVSLAVSIYNLCRWSHGDVNTTDLVVNLVAALANCVPVKLVQKAFSFLFAPRAQVGGVQLILIAKSLLVLVFLVTASSLPGKHTVDEFINRIHSIPRAMTGMEQFWSKLDPIVKIATEYAEEKVFGYDMSASGKQYIDEVEAWAERVAELSELYKRRLISRDVETLLQAGKVHVDGIRLLNKCKKLGYDRKNVELIRSLLATTYKISESALRSGADKCRVRREPVMVWMNGGSGVGKSTVTYPFLIDMMKSENNGKVPPTWQQNIYARAPETEFWDGYQDQEYIVYDDAFQLKDSIANPSPELFEIIRLGNMFPYMLHMASIEDKANSFACPRMVFMSSNLDRIIAESIHCKEAIERRIQFAYHVEIKEKYRFYYQSNGQKKYRLDTSKVDKTKAIDLSVYQFVQFDTHTGLPISSPMDYAQVVHDVGKAMQASSTDFSKYDDFLKSYAEEGLPKYDDPWGDVEDEVYYAQIGFPGRNDSKKVFSEMTSQGQYDYRLIRPGYGPPQSVLQWLGLFTRNGVYMSYLGCKTIYALGKSLLTKSKQPLEEIGMQYDHFQKNKFIAHQYNEEIITIEELDDYEPIVSQAGQLDRTNIDIFVRVCRRKWWQWKSSFLQRWAETRRTLPGMLLTGVGFLTMSAFIYGLYRKWKQPSQGIYTQSAMATIDKIIDNVSKAEECHRNGCDNCQRCNALLNKTSEEYAKYSDLVCYWGVACVCYIDVCEAQTPENRKLFLVHLRAQSKLPEVGERIRVQQMVMDFSRCVCSKCPICVGEECVCIALAKERGCAVGSDDLLDRCGVYSQISERAQAFLQGKNLSDETVTRRRITPKVRLQGKNASDENVIRTRQVKQTIRVQNDPVEVFQPSWRKSENYLLDDTIRVEAKRDPSLDMASLQIQNRVWPSILRVYLTRKGEDTVFRQLGHCLALGGKLFLMNFHFQICIEDYPEFDLVLRAAQKVLWRGSPHDILSTCVRIPGKDAVVFSVDYKSVSFPNIVHYFISKEVHLSNYTQCLTLSRYQVSSVGMIPSPYTVNDATLRMTPIAIQAPRREADDVVIVNPTSWEYAITTVDGDCGAPLILNNSRIPAKIVGIHNAASQRTRIAFGVPIYIEDIKSAIAQFDARLQYGTIDEIPMANLKALDFDQGDNFIVVGCEKGPLPAPSQSILQHSPIFEEFIPTLTRPGFLKPFQHPDTGETIDPAVLARKKWGYHQPLVDKGRAERVTNLVVQIINFAPERNYFYQMPLTTEQAIVGIDGVDHIGSINKVSSPGYPFIFTKPPGKGKTGYFGAYEFDITTDAAQYVISRVHQMERKFLANERPFVVWIDTLKDARIPIEKALKGKTRIFSAGPMDYCIVYRKYFLPYYASLMKNRISNWLAPGINVCTTEWHKLATLLQSRGVSVLAGDYSNYDGKACSEGYKAACYGAIAWYREHWEQIVQEKRNIVQDQILNFDEFSQFLHRIFYECLVHVHVCEQILEEERYRVFYQVCNGMPSGNPGTAITNSVCGIWMLAYCWMEMTEGTDLCDPEKFIDNVYACTYGDDVVINISDKVKSWYNQTALTEAMKRNFDIDFTDEAKTGNIVAYRQLYEITFLKRHFKFSEELQIYICPMDEDILLDICNWVRSGNEDPRVITINNLQAVLGELALVSREAYNRWRGPFESAARKLRKRMDVPCIFDTYAGYLTRLISSQFDSVHIYHTQSNVKDLELII